MKYFIIFLDFDGVIITPRAMLVREKPGGMYAFDPIAIKILNRICKLKENVRVVVSSVWRSKNVTEILYAAGFSGHFFNINSKSHPYKFPEGHITGSHRDSRGEEIHEWYETYKEYVEDFLILDDESGFLDYQIPKHIKTDIHNGIGFQDYFTAEKMILK